MTLDSMKAVEMVLVVAVGLAVNIAARRGVHFLTSGRVISAQSSVILQSTVKWAILVLVIVTCLQIVGIPVTVIWASVSAVLMLVAVGFVAVWSILSNASCALFLVMFAPFRIGDEIEIVEPSSSDPDKPGLRGRVKDISFLYTTLEENNGDRVTLVRVPNNQFFQKAIRCRSGADTQSLKQALFEYTEAPRDES